MRPLCASEVHAAFLSRPLLEAEKEETAELRQARQEKAEKESKLKFAPLLRAHAHVKAFCCTQRGA